MDHEIFGVWQKQWDAATGPPRNSDAVPIRPERAVAELGRVVPADGIVLESDNLQLDESILTGEGKHLLKNFLEM